MRKVTAPIELNKKPPRINPKILATPPKLPAMPCTEPWSFDPAYPDNIDMKDGHIRPLPTANNVIAQPIETF